MSYTKTKTRYNSLLTRSRDAHLEYYAFEFGEEAFDLGKILSYKPSPERIQDYVRNCQSKESTIKGGFYDKIDNWFKINNENLNEFYTKYKEHFEHQLPYKEFENFYGSDENSSRACYYCEITEKEIASLNSNRKIFTRRLYTRGLKMEIDRKDPFGKYERNNIVLCCYWCNNAKTDEFSKTEFEPIAMAIKTIWQQRLSK